VLVLQVIVFLWCSFRTEICADIGQGKCCVIDWKSLGKSGNFVLEDLYEPWRQYLELWKRWILSLEWKRGVMGGDSENEELTSVRSSW